VPDDEEPDIAGIMASDNPIATMASMMPDDELAMMWEAFDDEMVKRNLPKREG
jgi:hypothetical protein